MYECLLMNDVILGLLRDMRRDLETGRDRFFPFPMNFGCIAGKLGETRQGSDGWISSRLVQDASHDAR